ncbi:tetratricopeptide repeat protein [Streptomyces guryensis]|uniref:Tetratricopeptide repeat protein n=1 Tax=Streptomyces guryensis TaxID=2886947 RepID=A0A9Q3Z929_9ACTN|nr:tetratricopeptide repeat protein [Streptomyces guryensis]MCD9876162.1 tetratricopeptide repeat protein [Streptomyces guryensis]
MARLSREKKREQKRAEGSAAFAGAPIDVRVPEAGAVGAWVGGVPVTAAAGEEIQQAVLNHLHRIALATGHPVHATVHDERIGYVLHVQVDTDGASSFTGEPVGMTAQSLPPAPPPPPAEPQAPAAAVEARQPGQPPRGDKPTHVLRASAEPARESPPTFVLRGLPQPPQERAPGTVAAPTGEFGPPPLMDAVPRHRPEPEDASVPGKESAPTSRREPADAPAPDRSTTGPLLLVPPDPALDPDPRPTPARGFDAVAEAVLGDEPPTVPAFLVEPMAQINEAVRAGRTEAAAGLAETTVKKASAALGPEHIEVLRLRELTAYIAYLAGDPVRAFRLSLDLARIHRRTRDAEAAYGNIQSAASAWRAVRDPQQGLDLGGDLIGLWTELTAEGGPAAEDIERLESARTRMGRLTERARKAGRQTPG